MKPLSETLVLPRSLRDARLAETPDQRELEQRIQARERDSFEKGRREGERALSEQLVRQRTELLELHHGALAALKKSFPQVARDCEATLIALAIEVAQKLVAAMPISPEMVEASIREGIARLEDTGTFSIHLHPDDLALLRRVDSPLLAEQPGGERIRFDSSPDVSRGGCIVETRFGLVDARRETKLQLLRESLLN